MLLYIFQPPFLNLEKEGLDNLKTVGWEKDKRKEKWVNLFGDGNFKGFLDPEGCPFKSFLWDHALTIFPFSSGALKYFEAEFSQIFPL